MMQAMVKQGNLPMVAAQPPPPLPIRCPLTLPPSCVDLTTCPPARDQVAAITAAKAEILEKHVAEKVEPHHRLKIVQIFLG